MLLLILLFHLIIKEAVVIVIFMIKHDFLENEYEIEAIRVGSGHVRINTNLI